MKCIIKVPRVSIKMQYKVKAKFYSQEVAYYEIRITYAMNEYICFHTVKVLVLW